MSLGAWIFAFSEGVGPDPGLGQSPRPPDPHACPSPAPGSQPLVPPAVTLAEQTVPVRVDLPHNGPQPPLLLFRAEPRVLLRLLLRHREPRVSPPASALPGPAGRSARPAAPTAASGARAAPARVPRPVRRAAPPGRSRRGAVRAPRPAPPGPGPAPAAPAAAASRPPSRGAGRRRGAGTGAAEGGPGRGGGRERRLCGGSDPRPSPRLSGHNRSCRDTAGPVGAQPALSGYSPSPWGTARSLGVQPDPSGYSPSQRLLCETLPAGTYSSLETESLSSLAQCKVQTTIKTYR